MKLSTKGRYAMVALADIAMQPEGALVSLGEIAERQDISLPYLEQLFVKLRRVGLVDSVRGPGGGYRLAGPRPRSAWSEILGAVDETVSALPQGRGARRAAPRARRRRSSRTGCGRGCRRRSTCFSTRRACPTWCVNQLAPCPAVPALLELVDE